MKDNKARFMWTRVLNLKNNLNVFTFLQTLFKIYNLYMKKNRNRKIDGLGMEGHNEVPFSSHYLVSNIHTEYIKQD